MTRKEVNKKYKESQKNLATKIRDTKYGIKDAQRNLNCSKHYTLDYSVQNLKREFRHHHIAICLLKGRTYEQVENKCADDNKPDFDYIEKIQKQIKEEVTEDQVEELVFVA